MAREAIVQGDSPNPEEDKQRDAALRPRWLKEVIGQRAVVQRLNIALNAARKLKDRTAHGFKRKRSIITNARQHRHRRWVFNLDLEEFFPSINFGRYSIASGSLGPTRDTARKY